MIVGVKGAVPLSGDRLARISIVMILRMEVNRVNTDDQPPSVLAMLVVKMNERVNLREIEESQREQEDRNSTGQLEALFRMTSGMCIEIVESFDHAPQGYFIPPGS